MELLVLGNWFGNRDCAESVYVALAFVMLDRVNHTLQGAKRWEHDIGSFTLHERQLRMTNVEIFWTTVETTASSGLLQNTDVPLDEESYWNPQPFDLLPWVHVLQCTIWH
jgi:hypothetical protein